MSNRHDYPIPFGFTWNHVIDRYSHEDGRTWDSRTNVMYDKHDVPIKSGTLISNAVETNGATPDESVEAMIQRKGLTAPRVTQADVSAAIVGETYTVLPSGRSMICELTLKNGFTVRGESSVVSAANFNEEVGRRVSRENAVHEVWQLLGYALVDKLSKEQA